VAKSFEQSRGANENRTIAAQKKFGDAIFTGFEHTGAGYSRLEASGFDSFNGGKQAVEVEIVERDARGPQGDGGVELFGGADQQVQLRLHTRRDCRRTQSSA